VSGSFVDYYVFCFSTIVQCSGYTWQLLLYFGPIHSSFSNFQRLKFVASYWAIWLLGNFAELLFAWLPPGNGRLLCVVCHQAKSSYSLSLSKQVHSIHIDGTFAVASMPRGIIAAVFGFDSSES
jgi:hypothetical protein